MNNEKLKYFKEGLNRFGKAVVFGSLKELKKQKKGSGNLARSLMYKPRVYQNSLSLEFIMNDYGLFQDKGIKGVGGVRKMTSTFNRRNNKGKMWKQKGKNSPFSFKKDNKPSVKHFKDWASKRGLNPFAIRESVFRQGIAPSLFFTKPFEAAFKNLPDNLAEDFALDLENFIKFTTKDLNKKF
tara:strand:- start:911 stop:1459 length:549 start_codon:yes stop_codon:yes gene_type:complete